ncbi:class I SAM-dependent methyltransferase [Sphingomonas parva]|uniref:Class I SAM-dependent methyltransferase n=1 Tax=Sphingomonas parva TaxID=2555898 RepID=A0A4Y8ZUM0_9SPHN|nr:class I SAM-dependent methyltransferase [Sphingomonas parva]TFI59733.1 class I SAM-dependent methyltransferase [Sphingomonas parva]
METRMDHRQAWDDRYSVEHFVFGREPNAFLKSCAGYLRPGMRALALADGEGRNGVWLAEQGLDVLSTDISPRAQEKARRLAADRNTDLSFELVDLASWRWPPERFDLVVAIFIQFAGPDLRERIFEGIRSTLKPGGLLLLEGYRPEQVAFGTGGPPAADNMYTLDMLREAFADLEIIRLVAYDSDLREGIGHRGNSALVDLVARKRSAPADGSGMSSNPWR